MTEPAPSTRRYEIVDFETLPGVSCPCGTARRAFADRVDFPATIHRTEITQDAETHYHKILTEIYYILDCGPDAGLELDGEFVPVRSGLCILIPPGVRHRGVGPMSILNIVFPKFDPADEWCVDKEIQTPASAIPPSGDRTDRV